MSLVGRVIGIDLGQARTGVALSDPTGTIASPLIVIKIESRKRLVRAIVALVAEHAAIAVVVGVPLSLDGTAGPAAETARAFIARLQKSCPVPVHARDERLTTVGAQAALHAGGLDTRASRSKIDMVAAALILQGYLDSKQNEA